MKPWSILILLHSLFFEISVQVMYNQSMSQINLNVTPKFEKHLQQVMKALNIKTKSDAIRMAIEQMAQHLKNKQPCTNFKEWKGYANSFMQNPCPRFTSDDDLWS